MPAARFRMHPEPPWAASGSAQPIPFAAPFPRVFRLFLYVLYLLYFLYLRLNTTQLVFR